MYAWNKIQEKLTNKINVVALSLHQLLHISSILINVNATRQEKGLHKG